MTAANRDRGQQQDMRVFRLPGRTVSTLEDLGIRNPRVGHVNAATSPGQPTVNYDAAAIHTHWTPDVPCQEGPAPLPPAMVCSDLQVSVAGRSWECH
jgi:hypothetical protein